MDLFDLFLLSSVLHKHMDGVTNDVERSNEMVSFIILTAISWLPSLFANDCELATFTGGHSARGIRS
jgi:hypothetical protein